MQERPRRRDAGVLQITERDITILTWIAEQYCLSYDHLQRLLAYYTPAITKNPDKVAPSTAQNALQRWLQLGYVDMPRKVIRGHPTSLWLSRKGLEELDLPYAYSVPKPANIRHIYAINTIRLHMQRFPLSAQWRAQRTIRLHSEHWPLPDAEFSMNGSPIAALHVFEQQQPASITIQDELATLNALSQRYTRVWCFLHAQAVPPLQTAIHLHDQGLPPDTQLAPRLVWYTLDAHELLTTTRPTRQ